MIEHKHRLRSLSIHRALALALVAALAWVGCSDDPDSAAATVDGAGTSDGDAGGSSDGAGADASAEDTAQDAGVPADTADAAVSDPCQTACIAPDACEVPPTAPACFDRCKVLGPDAIAACLDASADCAALTLCIGMVPQAKVAHPFDAVSATGTKVKDLAGDFTVDTTQGPFTLSQYWTGVDSFLFLFTAHDAKGAVYGYPKALWASNFDKFLQELPPDTHVLFATFNELGPVTEMQAKVAAALQKLPAAKKQHWTPRLHFVTTPLPPPGAPGVEGGWLGKWTKANGRFLLGIDPFQRVRAFGHSFLFPVEPQGVYLHTLAIEAQAWAFERKRADAAWKGEELVIDVAVGKVTGGDFQVDVAVPDPAVIAKYDTLEVEMVNDCPDHDDQNCGEWDYLEHLRLCERPVVKTNPFAQTPCQPAVAGVEGKEEAMGACELPDAATKVACKVDADCPGAKPCKGYQPKVEAVKKVDADTKACACQRPDGGESARVQTCQGDGKGYSDCGCGCDLEFGRWITTYSREGTWWTDLTPQLAHLQQGGSWPMRWQAPGQPQKCNPQDKSKCWSTKYIVTARLHLSNRSKGMRPVQAVRLDWPGGSFDATYSERQKAHTFDLPPGTKKVEVVAFISGHGFGADVANCAEFCNHEHHIALNGGKAFVKAHPEAGSSLGCKLQVKDGVVPNQFGTWPLGRGGWCPGLDVKPVVFDLTAQAKPTGNTLTYAGMFQGKPYTPVAKEGGSGFWGRVDVSAWLVFSK